MWGRERGAEGTEVWMDPAILLSNNSKGGKNQETLAQVQPTTMKIFKS